MPTYEYECESCGLKFERRQGITEPSLTECPEYHGKTRRLVSGGAGFILKRNSHGRMEYGSASCSMEQAGKTCCGRQEHCGKPSCSG